MSENTQCNRKRLASQSEMKRTGKQILKVPRTRTITGLCYLIEILVESLFFITCYDL